MIIKQNQKIRIDRLLSNLGLVERSSVPRFLNEKRVTIAGKKATISSKAFPQDIKIDGKPIENPSPLHLAIHKPSGYICSTVNDGDHKVIYDLLPKDFVNRKPIPSIAGRLDKWVTGLVIFSQDGKLVERIITPKDNGCGKDYEVILKNKLGGDEIKIFESGELMLRGETEPCKPSKLQVLDESKNKVKVTLYEGRYHQVRRMFAANDNQALEIHRTRIGPVELGDLPLGKWRHLTEKEVQDLYNIQVSETKKKQSYKQLKQEKQKDQLYNAIVQPDQSDKTYNDEDFSSDIFDEEDDQDLEPLEKEYELDEDEDYDYIDQDKDDKLYSVNKQQQQQQQQQQPQRQSTELNYKDKLNALIKDEKGLPIQETEEEINISISNQVKQLYNNVQPTTPTNDPYKELREQIHKKMRLKFLKNSNLVYDEDTGYYLPKKQAQDKMSDDELDRLIDSDQDFKEFEEHEVEQEQEDQQQFNKSKSRSLKLNDDNNNNNNNSSSSNNNNREKLKPSKVLDSGEEIYEIDSTPNPIDKTIRQKTSKIFNSKKKRLLSSKSLKRKN